MLAFNTFCCQSALSISLYVSWCSDRLLPHDKADRSKLGKGNNGLVDEESGIYQTQNDINQLNTGEVAILKGELWQGNGNAGLIHRSPQVLEGNKRLLLTLDFNN